jgi:hypothetical protein
MDSPAILNIYSTNGILILILMSLLVLFNWSFLRAYKESEKQNRKLNNALLLLLEGKDAESKQDKIDLANANDRTEVEIKKNS